jgi:leader peptidase (prepilin peptidase)/N-methyltransferase
MPRMPVYLVVLVLGAVIGSFLNVCIHRLPRGESVAWPASRCPSCAAPIAVYDNVPILSYLFLRGRCRACGASISIRYPLVELANALGYALILWQFGPGWPALIYALLFSALLVVSGIDLSHQIIPNVITLPGIVLGFLCAVTILPVGALDSLLGILVGGGILWGLAWASPYVFGKEGMGLGDIKLVAMVGAFLGWRPALLTIMVGAVVGSVVGLSLIALKVMRREQYIPFGPFLALGAVVAMLFYREVVEWYFGLLGPR